MWTSSMMMGGRRPPFTESGTFATDLDGWAQTGGSAIWSSSNSRTSTGSVTVNVSSSMGYTVPAVDCGGLTISVSIWHKALAGSGERTLSYKIGSGSFVTLASVTNSSTTYAQLSGSFENPGYNDVTIKLSTDGGVAVAADDWSISGA